MLKKILRIFSIIWSVVIIGVGIFLAYYVVHHLKANGTLTVEMEIMFLFLFIILLVLLCFMLYLQNVALWSPLDNWVTVLMIAIVTLNGFGISCVILDFPKEKSGRVTWFNASTFEFVIMGLMVGLYLLLDFIGSYIPTLPLFVGFSIQLVPLFFYGFLSKFLNTLVVCLISGLLVWFLPNNADAGVSYIAYLFDYLIPTSAIAFCALLKPKQLVGQTKKAKFSITLQWFVFIFIPLLIGYFSKVLSGVLFWFNATWGWGKWAYSLIYNLFNFIFDLATMLVIVPVICTTLRVLKEKYYQ
jgi:thiamine transporter